MRGKMNAILAPGICLMALCLFGSTAVLGADLEMELSCLPPSPGTATPGFWVNHPEAWPVDCIEIGGITFPKDVAIEFMKAPVKGDKTLTLFPALVAAKLNVAIGNDDSCIACTIWLADTWMAQYPVYSGVKANSDAWKCAEPLYWRLDAYNNGYLCAPSRDATEMELSCLPPSPGTATPGFWVNHPEAWPTDCIEIGGITFPKDIAIEFMKAPVKGDKTLTLFPALVAAKLNVAIGNDDSCIACTIAMADAWMAQYPVYSGVKANSDAWDCAEPLYCKLDAYNNGYLCAPSRDALE